MLYLGWFMFDDVPDKVNGEEVPGRFNLITSANDVDEAIAKFEKKLKGIKKGNLGSALDGVKEIFLRSITELRDPEEPVMIHFEKIFSSDLASSIFCAIPKDTSLKKECVESYGLGDGDEMEEEPFVILKGK